MLILRLNAGEEVVLFDKIAGQELGKVKFIKPQYPDPYKIPFGFDLPNNIQVLRAELVERKDSNNGNVKEQQ